MKTDQGKEAEVETATEETEEEIEKTEEEVTETGPKKETAAASAKSATETEEKVVALNAAEEVTSNVTAGDDLLAHPDHTTRAIDELKDHVAEADLLAELQNVTDEEEMTGDTDPILQTAVAMIDTTVAVEEEEEVPNNVEAKGTTVEVQAVGLYHILVRAPPDHLQGTKHHVNKGNTPKAAATAEVRASTAIEVTRG